jgi:hypothetical protein
MKPAKPLFFFVLLLTPILILSCFLTTASDQALITPTVTLVDQFSGSKKTTAVLYDEITPSARKTSSPSSTSVVPSLTITLTNVPTVRECTLPERVTWCPDMVSSKKRIGEGSLLILSKEEVIAYTDLEYKVIKRGLFYPHSVSPSGHYMLLKHRETGELWVIDLRTGREDIGYQIGNWYPYRWINDHTIRVTIDVIRQRGSGLEIEYFDYDVITHEEITRKEWFDLPGFSFVFPGVSSINPTHDTVLYTADGDRQLILKDMTTGQEVWKEAISGVRDADWTTDGSRVTFGTILGGLAEQMIFILDKTGTMLHAVGNLHPNESEWFIERLLWSPDTRYIFFEIDRVSDLCWGPSCDSRIAPYIYDTRTETIHSICIPEGYRYEQGLWSNSSSLFFFRGVQKTEDWENPLRKNWYVDLNTWETHEIDGEWIGWTPIEF